MYDTNLTEATMLRVSVETRAKIRKLGQKGETYDVIIRRLIREAGKGEAPVNNKT